MNHPTPPPLLAILRTIECETAKLSDAAANMDVTRHFTLDGRLVGDIGEMLAAQYLELTLDETQRRGHDGFTKIAGEKRDVQVKCRKASTLIGFSSVPDLLVVIAFSEDWADWEIVFNGEGTPIRTQAIKTGFKIGSNSRITKGNKRAQLDLNLNWFRSSKLNPFRTASVPERRNRSESSRISK